MFVMTNEVLWFFLAQQVSTYDRGSLLTRMIIRQNKRVNASKELEVKKITSRPESDAQN